ncbi:hypothetical protein AB0F52_46080 [Amycolatopsis sp. NPDC024027]|uniref:hypothetical protein n=1 Tax=Amycolatopsis sp. NPDC024027 TaxID=3154327 RepID=UPI0033F6F308
MSSSAESSSAESFGWAAFTDRPAPATLELISPASELLAALGRSRERLEAERAAHRRAVAVWLAAAAEQAVRAHQLGGLLDEHEKALEAAGLERVHWRLGIVQRQMTTALDELELKVVDPIGKPFDETEHLVDVAGWLPGAEFPAEVVAETLEPIVLHHDETVRRGRVIMGPPPTGSDTPRTDTNTDEETA